MRLKILKLSATANEAEEWHIVPADGERGPYATEAEAMAALPGIARERDMADIEKLAEKIYLGRMVRQESGYAGATPRDVEEAFDEAELFIERRHGRRQEAAEGETPVRA